MKHQKSLPERVRLICALIFVMGCLAYASASAASLSARSPARTRTPPGLARKTATPTRKHLPPGLAKKTGTPTAVPAWMGSVLINNGVCCVGGCPGQVVYLHVAFSASSSVGAVTEMRVKRGMLPFTNEEWEPFVPNKSYLWTIIVNWATVCINAQFRDEHGNVSPVYGDDIAQEGMGLLCPTNTPPAFITPSITKTFPVTPNTATPGPD